MARDLAKFICTFLAPSVVWCSVARLLRDAEGQSIHKMAALLVRLATGSKDQCTGRRGSIKPSRACQLCWPPQGLLAAKAFQNVT